MGSIRVFQDAFKYLVKVVENSIKNLNEKELANQFSILAEARKKKYTVITDGKGRSLQSAYLMEDVLEQNGFPIILPASNANLRPWKNNDILVVYSGSFSASPLQHAKAALADGLKVLGMTFNQKVKEEFPDLMILKPYTEHNSKYAPLGTEFELSSAVIGVCMAYSLKDSPEESIEGFRESTEQILKLYRETYDFLENDVETIIKFINLIQEYIPAENKHKIYFRGVGRDEIVNKVAAIRYGHLHKEPDKDLQVIYEHHWDLRRKGDLAIITSGSGQTSQSLNYAMQAFISGMKIFGITSFKDSDLGKFSERVNGCLTLPGRDEMVSQYNRPLKERKKYLPGFELNCYLTLDALLAQIAHNENITENDMKASHRSKVLE